MIVTFPFRGGNAGNARNSAVSQGSALFPRAHQAGGHGERIGVPVLSVPLLEIEREHGNRLPHKADLYVPSVPRKTQEANMPSKKVDATQFQDVPDQLEIELPACLDFPVSYGMGRYIDSDDALSERFSWTVEPGHRSLFWPWRESMTALDARYMRVNLVGMIEELAGSECWPRSMLDEVLSTAVRAPLSALLPDLHHFNERLSAARAEGAARTALDLLQWRLTDDE
jgi:hypothetical protein